MTFPIVKLYRQSLETLLTFQVNYFHFIKFPLKNVGNLNRAKKEAGELNALDPSTQIPQNKSLTPRFRVHRLHT